MKFNIGTKIKVLTGEYKGDYLVVDKYMLSHIKGLQNPERHIKIVSDVEFEEWQDRTVRGIIRGKND